MFRSSSLPIHEYDDPSSPDPLATSFIDENHGVPRHHSLSLKRSESPAKYTTVLEDITISTPQKSSGRNAKLARSPSRTVSEQTLSPWKIRVTVEAEPEDMNGNTRTTTRTVKVPLRQSSSPADNAKPERRGRGPQPGTEKTKRSGTPLRARNNSRNRRPSVTDLDITVLGDEGDSNDWTRQKSPRKRRPKQSKKEETTNNKTQVEENASNDHTVESSARPARRKLSKRNSFEIRQDVDIEEDALHGSIERSLSPELRSIDPNRVSMRSRSTTGQKASQPKDDAIDALVSSAKLPTRVAGARLVSNISAESYPTPTPSVQSDEGDQKHEADAADAHEGFDTILESEGFTMIDLESIPSARHFLSSPPISQSSSAEVPQGLHVTSEHHLQVSEVRASNRTPETKNATSQTERPRPTPIPSYLNLQEGESDISSNVPSSPPAALGVVRLTSRNLQRPSSRQITPQPYSSPKLPSPPKPLLPASLPIEKNEQKESPPSLVRVVTAGMALQGLPSPEPQSSSGNKSTLLSPYQRSGAPRDHADDLFEGFDSGTKRELRAGLRLGEELAKRQKPTPRLQSNVRTDLALPAQSQHKSDSMVQALPRTQVWRGETVVQHTPVQNFQQTEVVCEKRTNTSSKEENGRRSKEVSGDQTPGYPGSHLPTPSGLDPTGRRERKWQLEREAVSRQIENASSSQVIVIDSDEEGEQKSRPLKEQGSRLNVSSTNLADNLQQNESEEADEDDGDVWLAEAEASNSSSSNIELLEAENFGQEEQHEQRERAREVHSRARRSHIPSPWKRGEDIADASTFLTNGDMTGLYWQQPQNMTKFGAGAIEQQKRQMSDSFEKQHASGGVKIVSELTRPEKAERRSLVEVTNADNGIDDAAQDSEVDPSMLNSQIGEDDVFANDLPGQDDVASENESDGHHEDSNIGNSDSFSSYASSQPPQTVKIPVNFNDSTLSKISSHPPPLPRSSPAEGQDSSRPGTPRSAVKGARFSLGLDSPSARRVVFSGRSRVVDEHGSEISESLRSASPAPPPQFEVEKEVVEADQESEQPPQDVVEDERKDGWLGWLWGKPKAATESSAVSNTDGPSDEWWAPTKSSIPSNSSSTRQTSAAFHANAKSEPKTPTYLRPPSYPSDPSRDSKVPLATDGEFTNTHFRTLHIIYHKSLRPRFHAPLAREARKAVRSLLGEKFVADESRAGMGVFEWIVREGDLRVVERFMREVEFGWQQRGKECEWGWTEREIMGRLFRIVVGEVVRGEERTK